MFVNIWNVDGKSFWIQWSYLRTNITNGQNKPINEANKYSYYCDMCILLNITNSNNNITSKYYNARLLGKPTWRRSLGGKEDSAQYHLLFLSRLHVLRVNVNCYLKQLQLPFAHVFSSSSWQRKNSWSRDSWAVRSADRTSVSRGLWQWRTRRTRHSRTWFTKYSYDLVFHLKGTFDDMEQNYCFVDAKLKWNW